MELQNVELSWDRHHLLAPKPWRLAVADRTFSVEDVVLEGGNTRIQVDAHQDSSGVITLDGSGNVDLDILRAVIPGLTRSAGNAAVRMSAVGAGQDFVPEVTIDVSGGLFQGSWFPHAFEAVSGRIAASPSGFALSDAGGRLGGGLFTLDGTVDAEGWSPTRIALTTDVDNARVRYLDFLPAAVGDAQLTFGGPMDALLLSGDIQIDDMVFAERIDWESWVLEFSGEHLSGSVSEDTEEYFNLDLSVKGDNTIRFRNNVGDFLVSSDFQFIGNTSRPGLTGRVQVTPGGRVLLKEREFEINRAELRFSDAYAFDPDVDIDMRTEVSTREQDYDINYMVTGLYSDWRTTTRSEPGLPQADINALLLFGLTMEEMERYGGAVSALAVEGGDLLASKLGIVERVGQGVVGLDTFRPERIDLVSGVSERGSGSVSSDLRLLVEKDMDWATLIFEQNLSRSIDTYLGLERRLARMFYLRTYWAREQVGRRLDIGGAYGFEAKIRGELD
jgi:autotransporter translocation and assembly factor TamB